VNLAIRPAIPADAEAGGSIIYDAFRGIAERHGFRPISQLWKLPYVVLISA
jgi:hypothetical protein